MQVPALVPAGVGDTEIIDAPSAQELLVEIHKRATREQLDATVAGLQRKSAGFQRILARDRIADAGADDLRAVLRSVFATRRRVSSVLGTEPADRLKERVTDLLYGPDPLHARFDRFCAAVDQPPELAAELAGELLHFTDPEHRWPWARWMWNPRTRTGALPLVLSEHVDLEVDGLGAGYVRIGEAMTLLDDTPEAASFRAPSGGTLGTTVYLVGVYSVYMSTVLGLKMSQEFNAIVPSLPELARRLLGVHRMEV